MKQIACPECGGYGFVRTEHTENSVSARGCLTCNCDGFIDVPMTNADRIRAMSDEELAVVIAQGVGCVLTAPNCRDDDCTPCVLKWLKQPAEGE